MLKEIRLGETAFLHSVYEYINSNMYILVAEDDALIIDPHKNEELTDLLMSKGIKRVTILLTHEHHDHTTGIYWYQEHFESTLICQQEAAAQISKKQYLRPTLIAFVLGEEDHLNGSHRYDEFMGAYVPRQYVADVTYPEQYTLDWHNYEISFYHIPGHSLGSNLIVLDGQCAFTGDSLLKGLPVIIRFPGGDKEVYLNTTLPLLNRLLTSDMTIFPGHGNPFLLKDIMKEGEIHVQFR